MSGWLLDINVLSELRRPSPNRRVKSFISRERLDTLWVSVILFAEIRFGIELVTDPPRRHQISLWLENNLRPMFEGRILPINEDILLKWRFLIADGRKRGYTFSHPDVLIAATAAHHDLTVVTRNVDEFAEAGLAVFNPWTGDMISAH